MAEKKSSNHCRMAFSPLESPVYGGSAIVVAFSEDVFIQTDSPIYLVFQGGTERHVTTARCINAQTLQAVVPGHNQAESVELTVCVGPTGHTNILATGQFFYMKDSAHYMAQYLAASVYDPSSLEDLEQVKGINFDLAEEDYTSLDDRLTAAFEHLDFPEHWCMLGVDSPDEELLPRETLLHFAARLGLQRFAGLLLEKLGAEDALDLCNRRGELPRDIARDLCQDTLAELLSQHNRPNMMKWTSNQMKSSNKVRTDGIVVTQHEHGLSTITTNIKDNPTTIDQDIAMLCDITSLMQGGNSRQGDPQSPHFHNNIWLQSNNHEHQSSDFTEESDQESDYDNDLVLGGSAYTTTQSSGGQGTNYNHTDSTQRSHHSNIPGQKNIVLEKNIRRLNDISIGIRRLKAKNENLGELEDRKENLSRFSASCPSLDKQNLQSQSRIREHDSDYCKSMLDITPECDENATYPDTPPIDYSYGSVGDIRHTSSEVKIKLNDVTLDSSEDYYGNTINNNNTSVKLRQRSVSPPSDIDKDFRRQSWCVNQSRRQFKTQILAAQGKSLSLSSLDGPGNQNEVNEEYETDDTESPRSGPTVPSRVTRSNTLGTMSTVLEAIGQTSGHSSPETEMVQHYSHLSTHSGTHSSTHNTPPRPVSTASVRSLTDVRFDFNSSSEHETSITSPQSQSDSPVNANGTMLNVPNNMTKSKSTPSIPNAENKENRNGHNSSSEVATQEKSAQLQENAAWVNEDHGINNYLHNEATQKKPCLSMIEFLNDPANFSGEDKVVKRDLLKEDKKRRSSVFAKFGSYRQKVKLKEENKKTHSFMPVSFSNATLCDVCAKSMSNKSSVQCESCGINVHDHSCKEQVNPCTRVKKAQLHAPSSIREKTGSLPVGKSLRSSESFKEKRSKSDPQSNKITSLSTSALPRNVSPPSKIINEETETLPTHHEGSISSLMSGSVESIPDEAAIQSRLGYINDPELLNTQKEAEAWSVTVDKKTLKKMNSKEVKRQDHIWELIATEKNIGRTLKVMRKIFMEGMMQEANISRELADRLFPSIDKLINIHSEFLQKFQTRQSLNPDKRIDQIGDILLSQFKGSSGEMMKAAYGDFCSKHKEGLAMYKDLLKSDRKFAAFIRQCEMNVLVKRQSIPGCYLLVTQRMTKYPLMIEAILKTTKDHKEHKREQERENLQSSLMYAKQILDAIDERIDARDRELRLQELYHKMDPRSFTIYKGKKFKKSDLMNRKLIVETPVMWKSARGKPIEVIAVVLSDLMFFMQENNQKFVFFAQDSKSAVISLVKLLVREKGDSRHTNGVYLISQNKDNPEMYELTCKTPEMRRRWIASLRKAIDECPADEEVNEEDQRRIEEEEEERRQLEIKFTKLREMLDKLNQKDAQIKAGLDGKLKLFADMMAVWGMEDVLKNLKSIYKDEEGEELRDADDLLQAAIQDASKLTILFQNSSSSNLSTGSVTDQENSSGHVSPSLPKRAETFGGFDSQPKGGVLKKRYPSSFNDHDLRTSSLQNLHKDHGSDVDSALGSQSLEVAPSGSNKDVLRRNSGGQDPNSGVNRSTSFKERTNRRLSTSFLQNLLTKQHKETEDSDAKSDKSSDRGSMGELSSTWSLGPPSREQVECVGSLINCMRGLAFISTQQSTQIEMLKAKILEAEAKVGKSESQRMVSEKKTSFRHNNQLEELRNLQESISQERQKWDAEKEKAGLRLETERSTLEEQQKQLETEREEMAAQKEELRRQREALQAQMDYYKMKQQDKHDSREGSPQGGPGFRNTNSPSHDIVDAFKQNNSPGNHRRCTSADLTQGGSFEPMKAEYSNSLKEPLNLNNRNAKAKTLPGNRSNTPPGLMTRIDSGSNVNNQLGPRMPIHLLSAANEAKVGVSQQHMPYHKLSTGSNPGSNSQYNQNPAGNLHKLPYKLASTTSPNAPGGGSQFYVHQVSPPQTQVPANNSNSTLKQAASTGSFLPMKLASNSRAKSNSPGTAPGVGPEQYIPAQRHTEWKTVKEATGGDILLKLPQDLASESHYRRTYCTRTPKTCIQLCMKDFQSLDNND
ncbi:unnamed protein product [Owenia fusiformis]|uniref:Rho guanine nucleotide exchange factor 28 n=1 Tax=Owenia fusiformis TaxID=6347 RepID=A0A8S4PR71_OWEFU|nr:unnamed protein product [Owenia fusiformis]